MCIINKYSNTYIKNYNELNYLNIIHIEHHKKVLQIGYIVSRLLNSIELGQQLTYSAERFLDYLHEIEDIDTRMRDELQTISNLKKGVSV